MKHTETRETQTGNGVILTAPKQPAEVPEDAVEETQPDIIYNNNIELYVDDFIMFNYPDKTREELKQDKAFFPLLVKYIYDNYIGDLLKNKTIHKVNKIKPEYNINNIDLLFDIYIDLVYKYKWNNRPLIIEFSLFTGINRDTFYDWLNGNNNNNICGLSGDITTSGISDTVSKWVATCERALVDGNDTIKDIFILKAKHGYRDNNNDVTITVNHKAIVSADVLPDLIGLKDSKD